MKDRSSESLFVERSRKAAKYCISCHPRAEQSAIESQTDINNYCHHHRHHDDDKICSLQNTHSHVILMAQ